MNKGGVGGSLVAAGKGILEGAVVVRGLAVYKFSSLGHF